MSAALVKRSLALLEDTSPIKYSKKRKQNVLDLIPESKRLKIKLSKKNKSKEVSLIKTNKKLTIVEAKKSHKSKLEIAEENRRKLELLREACKIDLDKETTKNLLQRAVTKRPLKYKRKQKKDRSTAFTEEDFKKFEEEYYDESNG